MIVGVIEVTPPVTEGNDAVDPTTEPPLPTPPHIDDADVFVTTVELDDT
jgi:hypothetical protein